MSVFVNGSITLKFQVGKGLHQEDHLPLFLFLLVVEGLKRLMHNATTLGEFQEFHFNDDIHFELLQFLDDTIIVYDGSWKNLRSIKAMLRGFDMVS